MEILAYFLCLYTNRIMSRFTCGVASAPSFRANPWRMDGIASAALAIASEPGDCADAWRSNSRLKSVIY